MPHRACLLLVILIHAALASPAAAQHRVRPAWTEPARAEAPAPVAAWRQGAAQTGSRPLIGYMVVGGAVAGALGAAGGAVFTPSEAGFDYRGAALGAALAIPVGVHVSNRARGNLLLAELVSLGVAAAAMYGTGASSGDWRVLVVAAPALELSAAVLIEALTTEP